MTLFPNTADRKAKIIYNLGITVIRTTACQVSNQVSPNFPIFTIKSVLYGEVIKNGGRLDKLDHFVQPDVLLTVHSQC
jgi:hypothetical protein